MSQAFTDPRGRFFDKNGLPLSNGRIKFYVVDSETPAVAYSDYTLETEVEWPLELNGSGQVLEGGVFLGKGLYKIVVESYIGRDENGTKQYKLEYTINGISGNDLNSIIATGFRNITNVVDLRNLEPGEFAHVYCSNHTEANDDGGGWFVWDATSNYGDDGGSVIAPLGNPVLGRYIRLFNGVEPNIRMWGAIPSASNVIGNLTNAINYTTIAKKSLVWPSGDYQIGDAELIVDEGKHIIEDGCTIVSTDNVDFTGAIFSSDSLSLIADNLIVSETDKGYVRPEWWGVERDGTTMQGDKFLKCITNSTQTVLCSERYLVGDTILDNGRIVKTNYKFVEYGELDTIGTLFAHIGDVINEKANGEPVVSEAFLEYIILYGAKYYTSDFGISTSENLYDLCLPQTELITMYTDSLISFNMDLALFGSIVTFDFIGEGQWQLNGFDVTVVSLVQNPIARLIPHVDSLVSIRDSKVYKANMFGGNIGLYNKIAFTMLILSAAEFGKTIDFENNELSSETGINVVAAEDFKLLNGVITFDDLLADGLTISGDVNLTLKNIAFKYTAEVTYSALKIYCQHNIQECEIDNGDFVVIADGQEHSYILKNKVNKGSLLIFGDASNPLLGSLICRDNFFYSDNSITQGCIEIVSQSTDTIIRGLSITDNVFEGNITTGTIPERIRIKQSGSWDNSGNNVNTDDSHNFEVRDNTSSEPDIQQYIPATQGSFQVYMPLSGSEPIASNLNGIADNVHIDLQFSIEWLNKVFTLNGGSERSHFTELSFNNGLMWYDGLTQGHCVAFAFVPQRHEQFGPTGDPIPDFASDQTVGLMKTNNTCFGIRYQTASSYTMPAIQAGGLLTGNFNFRLYDGNVVVAQVVS